MRLAEKMDWKGLRQIAKPEKINSKLLCASKERSTERCPTLYLIVTIRWYGGKPIIGVWLNQRRLFVVKFLSCIINSTVS
jgi:hypothetical protein